MQRTQWLAFGAARIGLPCLSAGRVITLEDDSVQCWVDALDLLDVRLDGFDCGNLSSR
jgi:hypothetical protein